MHCNYSNDLVLGDARRNCGMSYWSGGRVDSRKHDASDWDGRDMVVEWYYCQWYAMAVAVDVCSAVEVIVPGGEGVARHIG